MTRRGRARDALLMGGQNYDQLILGTRPGDLIGYWPLDEASGTVAYDHSPTGAHGAYAGTVTLGGASFGNKPAPLFGGRVSLATNLAALDTPFDPLAGTLVVWFKPLNAAFWTDGNFHEFVCLGADVNNRINLYKANSNNALGWLMNAGGTSVIMSLAGQNFLTWAVAALTWDKAANQIKAFLNGSQISTTQVYTGAWVGALSASWSAIGSLSSSADSLPMSGYLIHNALWKSALTPSLLATLYQSKLAA